MRECLKKIREQSAEYSRQHPEMPISYAAGYALSSDFEGSTMRELFRFADKNMYIDKNRAKIEEAAEKQKMNIRILEEITEKGYQFSDCIYCDALLDQYYVLRASSHFSLQRMEVIQVRLSRSFRNWGQMRTVRQCGWNFRLHIWQNI